ncbi:MAG: pyridoxal phosphate-dependent aminotransferase [Mogibacterium sp.]|nr:pyridoxal phosphate-dependent aminotransferase [Mogibacterium sp.]MBQ6501471.1 pyridoxal phosphate-dependent aminotransferase [Mogibacterium sp.]
MISQRIKRMTPSATSTLNGMVSEMKARGEHVISFNVGEPDFDTPAAVREALKEATDTGKTRYVAVGGITPLREAIAAKLKKDNGLNYTAEQICVSTGGKQAVFNAVMTICDPGDEVIVVAPCWVSYVEMIKLAEAVPIVVESAEDYHLSINNIRAAITNRTKAIIINTPNNPTGAVYNEEELKALAELAKEHEMYILSDEIYEKLIYGDKKHVSIASISQDAYDRTITLNGFAKAYCMTGWRLGYAAGPADIIKGMISFQGHSTSNSTTMVQWAGIAALEKCDTEVEEMRQAFEKRRDYMKQRLDAVTGIKAGMPDGAFYFMPDVSCWFDKTYTDGDENVKIGDAQGFSQYLLREAGVAVVPGDAFEAPNTVRFAYPVSVETIKEGMDKIEAALAKLK